MDKNELMLRLIKVISIIVISNIYFFSGIISSHYIRTHIAKDYDENKSKLSNFLQLMIEVSVIVIVVYILRVIIKNIPNPLDSLYGFKHSKLRELNGNVILAFSFIFFMKDKLHNKVDKLIKF